jgi:hypothetical protein
MTEKLNKQEQTSISGRSSDQLHHAEVRRFLNKMPLFKPDERRSDRFEDLLARLETSERPEGRH